MTPDLSVMRMYHAGHGRMNGNGACSWIRRGEEHCDAYFLAVRAEQAEAELDRLRGLLSRPYLRSGDALPASGGKLPS